VQYAAKDVHLLPFAPFRIDIAPTICYNNFVPLHAAEQKETNKKNYKETVSVTVNG
jgi:hypothetical protein